MVLWYDYKLFHMLITRKGQALIYEFRQDSVFGD